MKKWAAILAMAGAGRMIAVLYSGSLFLATIQQSKREIACFRQLSLSRIIRRC